MKKADFIKVVAAKAGTTQKAADTVLAAALGAVRDLPAELLRLRVFAAGVGGIGFWLLELRSAAFSAP